MNMWINEIDSSICAAALAYEILDSWKVDNAPRLLHSLLLGFRASVRMHFAVETPVG
jgi:hypothetical protein